MCLCGFTDIALADLGAEGSHAVAGHEPDLSPFVVIRQPGGPGLGRADREAVEATYRRFYEAFDGDGWAITAPREALAVRVFDSIASLRAYSWASEGVELNLPAYYSTRTNGIAIVREARSVGLRALEAGHPGSGVGGMGIPQGAGVSGYAPLSELDQRPCLMHEVAHLIAFNSGLQKLDRRYPLWFSEGLAASFELHAGQSGFGPGVNNRPRGKALRRHHAVGDLVPLEQIVSTVALPASRWAETNRFYAQAWGLFHFLYVHENESLRRYVRLVEQIDRSDFNARSLRAAFETALGGLDDVERRWHAWICSGVEAE